MDDLRVWAVIANAVISASYLAVALWAIPRIKTADPPPGYLGALVAMGIFFICCFFTHVALAYHVAVGDADWMLDWEHLVNHTVQALAAPAAFVFAALFLDVEIRSRERAVAVEIKPKEDES